MEKMGTVSGNLVTIPERTLKELSSEVEQLRVQLAGCSCAAMGATHQPAKQGDFGWSCAYQDVLDLRLKYDKLIGAVQFLEFKYGIKVEIDGKKIPF